MEAAPSDIRRHEKLWNGFCRFLTVSVIVTVATLGLMAIFLL